ncbi:MAG: SMP-30/gluconolactonase/LRE family protein [Verrucomicrobiales bacterium]
MPLSQVLIDGEDWEAVSSGHNFTDGLCTDAEGNLYFADVKGGMAIYKVDLDGNKTDFIPEVTGISGLQWGADGRLYACVARGQRVVSFSKEGEMKELATEVRPNDLVVTHDGNMYFTMTSTSEIRRIDTQGEMTVVDTGTVKKPNGITLSTDQSTLAVSDHGGKFVYAFQIGENGTLNSPQAYMEMRTPVADPEIAQGDGMATDAHGRWYVTTAVGLQMYDPTGRMGGVIAKPKDGSIVSVCFAGPGHEYLYLACGDTVYRRKTQTKGALFFQEPHKRLKYEPKKTAAVDEKPSGPTIYENHFDTGGNAFDPVKKTNDCYEFRDDSFAFYIEDLKIPTGKGVTLRFSALAKKGNLDLEKHKDVGLLQIDVYDS